MIHPSNRWLRPSKIEPVYDYIQRARTVDWFFRDAYTRALEMQTTCYQLTFAIIDLRRFGPQYSMLIKEFSDDVQSLSHRARASLFVLIGDGKPWDDPVLTLWEGAE